jgi:hypothetical protein
MSITVSMPRDVDALFKEAALEGARQAAVALAAKHGFDVEEAHRFLGTEVKVVRKRGPSPKAKPASSDDEEAPKTVKDAKKTKKTKKEADPTKPKRGTTGYLVFGKSVRAEVTQELSAELDGEKPASTAVTKAIAARWSALGDEQQALFKLQATELNEEGKPNVAGAIVSYGSNVDEELDVLSE